MSEHAPTPPGWQRHLTRTRVIVAGLVSALATVLGILGHIYDLFPFLRPDEPCARVHTAEVTKPTLDASLTRGESLDRLKASKLGVPATSLRRPGKLVSVKVSATGYEDDPLELRTWVLTASGAPVAEPWLRDYLVEEWPPEGCEDAKRFRSWSPVPRRAGAYQILIELRPKGSSEVIDDVRTEFFTVEPKARSTQSR